MGEFQGKGVGETMLEWMEQEALGACTNLWVSVSSFNRRALSFYLNHGFSESASFEDLLKKGDQEILLRKRLL